ncbi:MAG: nucleotide pyrophosphohydrolase [Proteobacteria bacterium]|nr:nucleotide pyrophosphohydrolase [Pseudomonadota bacterium]
MTGGTLQPTLDILRDELRHFASDRNWDQFHSPKNLAMALAAEAAEVLEHFQWLKEEESKSLPPKKLSEVREELADVLIYLVRLADKLGIELLSAASDKIALNARRYPIESARGNHRKYTELQD